MTSPPLVLSVRVGAEVYQLIILSWVASCGMWVPCRKSSSTRCARQTVCYSEQVQHLESGHVTMLEQEDKRSPWWWFLDFLIGYLPFLPVQMFALHDMMSQMETGGGKVFAVACYICMVTILSGGLSELGYGIRYRWRKRSDNRNSTKDENDTAEKVSLKAVRADRVDVAGGDEYDLFVKYGLGNQDEEDSTSEGVRTPKGKIYT